ncbi:MAG TPA: hypothetical protein VEO54_25260 [Thermoanaerobaculia bacterium]|nr:hypothetical protein [Thermoanaerobaculia bacterium]
MNASDHASGIAWTPRSPRSSPPPISGSPAGRWTLGEGEVLFHPARTSHAKAWQPDTAVVLLRQTLAATVRREALLAVVVVLVTGAKYRLSPHYRAHLENALGKF